jgi:hypothetical protein
MDDEPGPSAYFLFGTASSASFVATSRPAVSTLTSLSTCRRRPSLSM